MSGPATLLKYSFFVLFSKLLPHPHTHFLAQYLCELTILEYSFLKYLPSEIAAAAVVLALHTLDKPFWDASLCHHSGYQLADLLADCVPALHAVFLKAHENTHDTIRLRYSHEDTSQVGLLNAKSSPPPSPLASSVPQDSQPSNLVE